jgi:cytochrome c biogenesis protein
MKKFRNYYEFKSHKNLEEISKIFMRQGFQIKKSNNPSLVIAKKGTLQKLGYIFTHLAIIVISVGGLLDGNLLFKIQQTLGIKEVETRNLKFSEVPSKSQLNENNFSYRATLMLNEKEKNDKALIRAKDGYLVQHLPFEIKLDKFYIEHYSTGQPKSFLSDIRIQHNGEEFLKTISVNKPVSIDGVTIYQSDFQDGGSRLSLTLMSLFDEFKSIGLSAEVYKQNEFNTDNENYVFEFDDFREFNIFQVKTNDALATKNIGPSVVYKFRNSSGQALEYQTYQNPIPENDKFYFMSGMRQDLQSEFRFLRIPADNNLQIGGYQMFVKNLKSDVLIKKNINQLINKSSFLVDEAARKSFQQNTYDIFQTFLRSGYTGIASVIEKSIPIENQETVAESYIKIIYFLAETINQDLIKNQLIDVSFIQDALNTYSDSFFYGPSPFVILNEYEKIYASGLQLTKDPGKIWVYIGALFLVIGIFCMIYVQEVRVWIIRKTKNNYAIAFASNREHIDFDRFCENIVKKLNI